MNMSKRLLLLLLFGCPAGVFAQTGSGSPEELVRRVADHVIGTTSFQFVNNKTGEKSGSASGLAVSPDVKAESKFNKWMYVNGVLTDRKSTL